MAMAAAQAVERLIVFVERLVERIDVLSMSRVSAVRRFEIPLRSEKTYPDRSTCLDLVRNGLVTYPSKANRLAGKNGTDESKVIREGDNGGKFGELCHGVIDGGHPGDAQCQPQLELLSTPNGRPQPLRE